jgi:integrase
MSISQRRDGFQVCVERRGALPGYQRIRRQVPTREAAEKLEAAILKALETHGMWPIQAKAPALPKRREYARGTVRKAAELCLDKHWRGMRYYDSVRHVVMVMVEFFEGRGKPDMADLTLHDLDALVEARAAAGNAPSHILKYLNAYSVIAAKAPFYGIVVNTLPRPTIKVPRKENWWMSPEDHRKAVAWLREDDRNLLFADLIDMIVYEGLRVEEALRLEPRHFTGMDTAEPWIKAPGTKTKGSEAPIPLFPEAIPVAERSILRAEKNRWTKLFPINKRQVETSWNHVRRELGAENIPTATMKALRRTFAAYANSRGMPTATIQQVLRHQTITTTEGYLKLQGSRALDESRRYFSQVPTQPDTKGMTVGSIIQDYMKSGASPEEVARFVKEMMA